MKKEKISDAVIRRLPRYYRYLDELHAKGIVHISSGSLGKRMGVTASQIRQDLSCFGEFGQQGYGYNIMELRAEIGHILGVDDKRRLIVVGAGHLGHALLQNFDFDQGGFLFDTAFDVSPAVIGTTVNGVTIRGMDELDAYCTANHPSVAVLTVPSASRRRSPTVSSPSVYRASGTSPTSSSAATFSLKTSTLPTVCSRSATASPSIFPPE